MVAAPLYPLNLVLEHRRCLVVGAGRVAAFKIGELLECGATVHVVAPVIGDEVRALESRGVTFDEREYAPEDIDGCWFVVAATRDPSVNRWVRDDCDAHGVWVNSADDPENCSAMLPARVRQGPLLVTFATSGQSPALATWLRRRFSEEFGPEYAKLIEVLAEARNEIKADGRSTEGRDWQAALDSGMLDLIREGNLAEAKERLQACLSSSSD